MNSIIDDFHRDLEAKLGDENLKGGGMRESEISSKIAKL